jgi:hypothetical protein
MPQRMDEPADPQPLLPSSKDYSKPLNSRTLQIYLAFRKKTQSEQPSLDDRWPLNPRLSY